LITGARRNVRAPFSSDGDTLLAVAFVRPSEAITAATARRREQDVPIFQPSKRWARVAIQTDTSLLTTAAGACQDAADPHGLDELTERAKWQQGHAAPTRCLARIVRATRST
jgi:hypothetical protein